MSDDETHRCGYGCAWCLYCGTCLVAHPDHKEEPMKDIKTAVFDVLPCWCDEAYTLRKMAAPDCPRCQFADEVIDLIATLLKDAAHEPYRSTLDRFGKGGFGSSQ